MSDIQNNYEDFVNTCFDNRIDQLENIPKSNENDKLKVDISIFCKKWIPRIFDKSWKTNPNYIHDEDRTEYFIDNIFYDLFCDKNNYQNSSSYDAIKTAKEDMKDLANNLKNIKTIINKYMHHNFSDKIIINENEFISALISLNPEYKNNNYALYSIFTHSVNKHITAMKAWNNLEIKKWNKQIPEGEARAPYYEISFIKRLLSLVYVIHGEEFKIPTETTIKQKSGFKYNQIKDKIKPNYKIYRFVESACIAAGITKGLRDKMKKAFVGFEFDLMKHKPILIYYDPTNEDEWDDI